MDAYLAVVTKREVRRYLDRPVPDGELRRILQAARATGSSRNSQPWRFVVVRERENLARVARLVSRPGNIEGCAAAIAIVSLRPQAGFDAGRCAQNLMLAAWGFGVGSCPNTPTDQDSLRAALASPEGTWVPTIVSLGYPASGEPRPPKRADPDAVLGRIRRSALDELVSWERYGRAR